MTHRFDTLTKSFATKLSRRTALRTTSAGIAVGLVSTTGRSAMAQDATPVTSAPEEEDSAFLFVQTATSGSFTAAGDTEHVLTLDGHHGGTVYFSDRPERIFGEGSTQQFLDGLGFSSNNPPNAALVTQTDDGTQDVVVLELTNPSYDEGSGTLSYGATILSEYQGEGLAHVAAQQQDTELPENFGRASLFIDDCPDSDYECWLGAPDSGGKLIGDLGKQGTCFHWSNMTCEDCHDYSAVCDERFPACENNCGAWQV